MGSPPLMYIKAVSLPVPSTQDIELERARYAAALIQRKAGMRERS